MLLECRLHMKFIGFNFERVLNILLLWPFFCYTEWSWLCLRNCWLNCRHHYCQENTRGLIWCLGLKTVSELGSNLQMRVSICCRERLFPTDVANQEKPRWKGSAPLFVENSLKDRFWWMWWWFFTFCVLISFGYVCSKRACVNGSISYDCGIYSPRVPWVQSKVISLLRRSQLAFGL